MDDNAEHADKDRLTRVAEIVSSYVSHNPLTPSDLPKLIAQTHRALRSLTTGEVPSSEEPPAPAVPIKKSITPDFLICLDDGLKFKSLKRHLAGLGMTPDQYRAKWGLSPDYPMVAPNYATTRSLLAKSSGLGRKNTSSRTIRRPAGNRNDE